MINANNINLDNTKQIKRYQLIKPIISYKIYETCSFNKASKSCFNELKSNMSKINSDTFTMRNIDTNEFFTFKIHENTFNNSNNLNNNIKLNQVVPMPLSTKIDKYDINNLIHINSSALPTKRINKELFNNKFNKQMGGDLNNLESQNDDKAIQLQFPDSVNKNNEISQKIELIESKITNLDLRVENAEEKITNINKEINQINNKKEDQCIIC